MLLLSSYFGLPIPTVTVLIINYNTRDELCACLESLRDCAVLVFDNHSSDGSTAMVGRLFPGVRVVESEVNLGYGAAANRAIRLCSSDYVVVCNSDVIFASGAVRNLAEYLDRHASVGLAGPRLMNRDGSLQPSCFPLPGSPAYLLNNKLACSVLRRVPWISKRFLLYWDHSEERVVPWVKGAVLATRRSAFEEVDGFDESFFMYYEEVDLCVRLAIRGWQIRFAPVAEVVHLGGVSTAKVRSAMAVAFIVSSIHFARTHFSAPYCILLRIAWNVVLAWRLTRDSVRWRCCRENDECQRILEDIGAWKQALEHRTGQPGEGAH
jgi:GT2 family glycosyltransferase